MRKAAQKESCATFLYNINRYVWREQENQIIRSPLFWQWCEGSWSDCNGICCESRCILISWMILNGHLINLRVVTRRSYRPASVKEEAVDVQCAGESKAMRSGDDQGQGHAHAHAQITTKHTHRPPEQTAFYANCRREWKWRRFDWLNSSTWLHTHHEISILLLRKIIVNQQEHRLMDNFEFLIFYYLRKVLGVL